MRNVYTKINRGDLMSRTPWADTDIMASPNFGSWSPSFRLFMWHYVDGDTGISYLTDTRFFVYNVMWTDDREIS